MKKEGQEIKLEEIDLRKVLGLLNQSKWIIIGLTLLGFVGARLYLRYTIPLYQAVASIKIEVGVGEDVSDITRNAGTKPKDPNDILGEAEVLRSTEMMEKLIRKLGIQVYYTQKGRVLETPIYQTAPFSVEFDENNFKLYDQTLGIDFLENGHYKLFVSNNKDISIEGENGKICDFMGSKITIKINPTILLEDIDGYQFVVYNINTLTTIILSRLNVAPTRSSIFSITYAEEIPKRAADIINALTKLYLQDELEVKRRSFDQKIKFIDSLIVNVDERTKLSETELRKFEQKNQMPAFTTLKSTELSKLGTYELERTQIEMQEYALTNLENYMNKILANPADTSIVFSPNLEGVNDQSLGLLIVEISNSILERKIALQRYTTKNLQVRKINQEIDDKISRFKEAILNLRKNLAIKKNLLVEKKGEISAKSSIFPQVERDFEGVERGFTVNETKYYEMLDKRTDSEISKAAIVSKSRIISDAYPPSEPIAPKRNQILFGCIFAGFLLGTVSTILRELLRTTFADRKELEMRSTVPIIAEVVQISGKRQSTMLPVFSNSRSAITESFRTLRANLQFVGSTKQSKLILVTSTISGEGKSFISLNLAGVLAMMNKRTLLIDLDLRKPRMHNFFNLDADRGISTLLIGRNSIQDVIQPTGYQNFDLIAAGPTPPNPAELLSSEAFREKIEMLSQHYDYIVVDTSPVGLVTDSIPVMKYADVVLYILRADFSKRWFLNSIQRLTDDHDLKNLFVVFNCISSASQSYGYYYTGSGYGYYSGYYTEAAHIPAWYEFWKWRRRRGKKKGSGYYYYS